MEILSPQPKALEARVRRPTRQWASVAVIVLATMVMGAAATSAGLVQVAAALSASALLLAICLTSPRRAVVVLLVWLAVLGTVRRLLLDPATSRSNDPLLLVAPVVVGLLVVVAARRGAFTNLTRLSKWVLLLTGLVLLAALNPLQGGIAVGAAGLLFVLVPMVWFWVGRALVDDSVLTRILRVVSLVSLAAAVYGLFQVYRGFPSWDQSWIEAKGYAALRIGTAVRPFASFSSSSEYVGLLAIGTVLWALRMRRASRTIPATLALIILVWALIEASVRGALVVVPITLGMTFATSKGFGLARTALAGIAALFVLGLAVSQFQAAGTGRSSALISRQVTGLSDPFNPEQSTLPLHVEFLVSGLTAGIANPVGNGLGVVTVAGEKFGEANVSTDVDPSNVALAMGIPGLLVYGSVVVLAFRLAFSRARRRSDFLTLAVLGVALVTLFQWLSGGNYAVAPLPWLLLGWLDHSDSEPSDSDPSEVSATNRR